MSLDSSTSSDHDINSDHDTNNDDDNGEWTEIKEGEQPSPGKPLADQMEITTIRISTCAFECDPKSAEQGRRKFKGLSARLKKHGFANGIRDFHILVDAEAVCDPSELLGMALSSELKSTDPDHLGFHVDVLRRVMAYRHFPAMLKQVYEKYTELLKRGVKQQEILVVCPNGQRLSVAIATMLQYCLNMAQLNKVEPYIRHPSRELWPRPHLKECPSCKNPHNQPELKAVLDQVGDFV